MKCFGFLVRTERSQSPGCSIQLFYAVESHWIHFLPTGIYKNGQKIAGTAITNEIQNDKRF